MTHLRLVVLPLLLLLLGGCGKRSHPTDDALLRSFFIHEEDFDRLLAMLRADKKLERVDDTWTRPEDPSTIGVTPDRIRSYRSLFTMLGIPRGFYAFHDPEQFTFLASARGLSVSGSAKGYAYMTERPSLVVSNLDTYQSEDGRSFTAYRHIKGSWYLYFDYED